MKEENSIHKSVTADDDRITKVGKYLRKFRIDELPQLLNILKGTDRGGSPAGDAGERGEVHRSPAGVLLPAADEGGPHRLAQIYGKYNTSPKDKLVMDLMYIENYSIWQDFKLIFQTVTVFLKASESTEAFGVEELYDFDEDRERNRKAKKRGQPRQEKE